MALGFTINKRYKPASGIRRIAVTITGDNPYPSGGTLITPANLRLRKINDIRINGIPAPLANRIYTWNRSTGKLMAMVLSTQVEVGSVDCSADKIEAEVIGS